MLAVGKVQQYPCPFEDTAQLKPRVVHELEQRGFFMRAATGQPRGHSHQVQMLDVLLRVKRSGGCFGIVCRWSPRWPERCYRCFRREKANCVFALQRNNLSVADLTDKVVEVLEDQYFRGQILKLCEAEARTRFPDLLMASLGVICKSKPNGVVTARVLSKGTSRTQLVASDEHRIRTYLCGRNDTGLKISWRMDSLITLVTW